MPSYLYRRQIAPSAIKETLADVKCRLQRELAQRTETRVKYWKRREEWCTSKPGRRIVIGWDTVIVPHPVAHEGACAESNVNEDRSNERFSTVKLARVSDKNSSFNPSALGAIASCEGGKLNASSCVEIPD